MEASDAYTRRKFADFKRLKRNLNVHRISSGNLADVYIFQPRSTASPSSLLPLTLQPSTLWPSTSSQLETVTNSDSRTDSPPEESSSSTQSFLPSRIARSSNWIEPIKRLNANIDDATELNRLRANDDETSIGWQIKQHRPKINGSHLEANAPPAAFVASELDVNLDRALEQKVSNEVHLMHDNNDSRRPYSFVGVNRQGNYLPPFNAYESDSLNPEVNTEQTKSHDPYEKPFNYANELNYGPNYASRIADDQYAKTKTLSESSASSLLLNPVKRLIGETDDYLSFGTKELITQRRSHRINIGKTAHFHSLQTNPDQKLSSRSLVINKQQQDDKMPISLNDEGFSRASQPIVGQSYSSKRNLANGLAKRFISDTRSRSHIWPYYRATRLSKRHRTSEQDDDHLEIDESRSAIAQSSLHPSLIDVHEMDITNQGVKVESERETEKAGSRSSQTTSEPTFSADQLNGERLLPDQKGTNRAVYSTSPPILHQNSYQALDSDDTLDESLMWSASHYLHMHMKALAASSMFGVEVGVEWSSERANQTNVPLDVELKSVPYPDEVRARIQPLSASPFATIDMLSGQDLQLECTAHTLGRLPEVKWYKKISRIPKRLKKANIAARRIGSDLYWPLTELDLLEDKPYGHTSFISSQTITVFDNLENQTFTVINNIQLSQYNDKVELQTIRHNNMPFSHYNLYACFVDADVRHDYATLGVNYRETLSKFALDFENRIRTRKAIPVSETSDWPSKAVPHGDNIYNMLRTSQINFPIGNHWIPIQNKSDFEDFGYETLPYAPAMLTITIVVVSASLLTLVYLTVRSYRGLVELQMEENLFNHKKVVSANSKDSCDLTNNYKIDKYNAKYCTFGLENRVECLCQLESEFIKGETLSFDTSDVEIETDFAFELEPSIPDQQVLEQQFYDSYYQNLDSFTNQQSPGCHYSGNSVIQDFSYGPIDSPIDRNTFSCNSEGSNPKDTSDNRDSINLFVNPLDSDAE